MEYKLNKIYNEDCLNAMKKMPNGYFELAIIDPPYGIGASNGTRVINKNKTWKNAKDNNNVIKGNWDNSIPSKEYFKELFRISKNQIIWGGNYFELPQNNNWIIWDKKITNHTFSPFEMAWSSQGKCKIFRWMLEGYKSENPLEMQKRFHPTQKPIALYEWLLKNYAKKGDKILDTHLGSGSSIIACKKLGFEYMAFELDKDYYDATIKRIQKFDKQINFFSILK